MKLEKNAYSVKILFGKQINGKQLKKCEVSFHFLFLYIVKILIYFWYLDKYTIDIDNQKIKDRI
jgi:hypothetical protein